MWIRTHTVISLEHNRSWEACVGSIGMPSLHITTSSMKICSNAFLLRVPNRWKPDSLRVRHEISCLFSLGCFIFTSELARALDWSSTTWDNCAKIPLLYFFFPEVHFHNGACRRSAGSDPMSRFLTCETARRGRWPDCRLHSLSPERNKSFILAFTGLNLGLVGLTEILHWIAEEGTDSKRCGSIGIRLPAGCFPRRKDTARSRTYDPVFALHQTIFLPGASGSTSFRMVENSQKFLSDQQQHFLRSRLGGTVTSSCRTPIPPVHQRKSRVEFSFLRLVFETKPGARDPGKISRKQLSLDMVPSWDEHRWIPSALR